MATNETNKPDDVINIDTAKTQTEEKTAPDQCFANNQGNRESRTISSCLRMNLWELMSLYSFWLTVVIKELLNSTLTVKRPSKNAKTKSLPLRKRLITGICQGLGL